MNPSSSKRKPKNPWSPTQIGWICMLFGPLPATVLWALNNRRLKLVQWRSTHIIVWASLAIYLLIVGRLYAVDEDTVPSWRFRTLILAMTVIVAWQLYTSQRRAFARHHKEGGKTATFWMPLVMGGICSVLWGCVSLGVDEVKTQRDYREFDRLAGLLGKDDSINQQAETFFKEFKRKHPNETMVHWNLVTIYDRTDRLELARRELRELLKQEPSNKEALNYLRELESPN